MTSRDNYINGCLKLIPWNTIGTIYVEDLKNLKLGKKKNRGKTFRKALAPWTYSQVIKRVQELAEENCVRFQFVPPAYTSQACPKCRHTDAGNRNNEVFKCLKCSYAADADYVGALNILNQGKAIRSEPTVPIAKSQLV